MTARIRHSRPRHKADAPRPDLTRTMPGTYEHQLAQWARSNGVKPQLLSRSTWSVTRDSDGLWWLTYDTYSDERLEDGTFTGNLALQRVTRRVHGPAPKR